MISPIIKSKSKSKSKNCLLFFIIALIASLTLLLLCLSIIYLVKKYQKKDPQKEESIEHKIRVEKVMKVFKPSFKINSKKNELTQILLKSIKYFFNSYPKYININIKQIPAEIQFDIFT